MSRYYVPGGWESITRGVVATLRSQPPSSRIGNGRAIGRAAPGGGSAALRIAHTPPRDVQLRWKSAKSWSAPTPYLLLPLPHPLLRSLIYSILFIPAGPRPLTLSRPRFCSFFVILRPRSVRALPGSPQRPSSTGVYVCVISFFTFLYFISFFFSPPVFAFLLDPRLRFPRGGNKLDRSARQFPSTFEGKTLEKRIRDVIGTHRWWHRSSIGFKRDVSAHIHTYIERSKSHRAFYRPRILIRGWFSCGERLSNEFKFSSSPEVKEEKKKTERSLELISRYWSSKFIFRRLNLLIVPRGCRSRSLSIAYRRKNNFGDQTIILLEFNFWYM